ncbi:iron-dicitrate transporter permease subunit [Aggregatibacter actinomycetemcomitans]|uniref:Iron-dicitrate ABC transporter permease FecC n=3 Tax=Aggregatibacter actinomycetemcomitans TaxID=714 RepID=A0A5D0EN38_AGGAC|nr:iron-dicitrate ABC transporter permease FecC [Aggregatibacter actinomycetemcomitans]AFI87260.1 iron-dicitrate transporter permease subunit [Aggregatibacter actinomycetemcomitans D7S-1]KYK96890.1 iron ABC transporter [Aggregatibacter actinomycetemcomitans serotype d str. SA3733]AMQ94455.1 iron-dicitrate transporter permease subunit [Aggregatibacter actinomycetemcomitans]ANU81432.1 iron-dicitrate transporter permease subunit [Aggregatibacter actinomycetemcomitans]EKX97732.1 fe(3+) dicitrate t
MLSSTVRWGLPIILLAFLLWGSLFLYYPIAIAPLDVLNAFLPDGDDLAKITVVGLRFPRALVAIALGANLAVAGALLQTVTRNPLASPSLLSVNSGAGLAMVIASVLSPSLLSGYSIALIASIGGGISWLTVMLISNAWHDNNGDRSRVILAGIAVSLLCAAATKLLLIVADDNAFGVMSWLAGGISHARWKEWHIIWPFLLSSALFCLFFASKLNLLNLSDESARSLGINLFRLRWYANIMALLIVGSAVSVAGPVAFIGLLIPHLARYWIGYDLRKSLPMSMLLGAMLMLIADTMARAVNFPNEVPAGAVLALIGAPVFVLFARGRR